MRRKTPELLSPAGDFERLEMVIHYGADAVYLAGQEFGMRAAADNFTCDALIRAVNLCHEHHVRVYVACNSLPHENEMHRLPAFLESVSAAGADACHRIRPGRDVPR